MHTNPHPHRTVIALLDKMKLAAKRGDLSLFERRSDELEVFTRAYILPEAAIDWRRQGIIVSVLQQRLLDRLFQSPGELVTRQNLMNAMYYDRPHSEPVDKIVDVFVCKLRKRLAGTKYEIRAEWGKGYMGFVAQPMAPPERIAA